MASAVCRTAIDRCWSASPLVALTGWPRVQSRIYRGFSCAWNLGRCPRAETNYLAVLPGRASGLVVLVLVSPRSLRAPRDVSRKRLFQQRPIRMDDDLPPRTLPNTCSGHGDVARVRQLAEHLGLGSAPGWVVSLFLRQPRTRRCCNVPCLCRRLASHTVCRIGDERKTIARMILA